MNARAALKALLFKVNAARSAVIGREHRRALVVFTFHSIFRDADEARSGTCDPQQGTTIRDLGDIIDGWLALGLRFTSIAGWHRDASNGVQAAITFDDGYANNLQAIDMLVARKVPASIYVSAAHIAEGKAYWWDALYRSLRHAGRSRSFAAACEKLKRLPTAEIELRLRADAGPRALAPISDIDRPLTTAELVDLSRRPGVTVGNHTWDHAILPNYDLAEARLQIIRCQEFVAGVTGSAPSEIAFPNGGHDHRHVALCGELGLTYALTCRQGLNLPTVNAPVLLKRYLLSAAIPIRPQLRIAAAGLANYIYR